MSTQRAIAAAFFSVVIVIVLGAIIYTDHISSSTTVSVYILNRDVPAGQIVAAGDFTQQLVHADEQEFTTAESANLDQLVGHMRYVLNMQAGDIVRNDDLTDALKLAEVPVVLDAASSGLVVGNRIDIYAFFNGAAVLVSGPGVTVISSGAGDVVIAVPSTQEAYWVTLAFSKPEMLATSTGDSAPTGLGTNTESIALCALSGDPTICSGAPAP